MMIGCWCHLFCVAAATGAPPTTQPGRADAQFAPGVTINWRDRQVEVAAEVVLRKGALELFACSRGTKEHESILRISARPLHVFQALGMLGLPDGQAPWFDRRNRRVVPPRGTPVDVRVRFRSNGRWQTDDARDWMRRLDRPNEWPAGRWYYIASPPRRGEHFGADLYGTVVTVVQFGTAIVMLAPRDAVRPVGEASAQPATGQPLADDIHVDTPEDWQLEPRDDRVPPVGTPVTLIIRPIEPGR